MFAAYKTRTSREFLDEYDDVKGEAMDFAALDTPAKWNSVCRKAIWRNYDLMRPHTLTAVARRLRMVVAR